MPEIIPLLISPDAIDGFLHSEFLAYEKDQVSRSSESFTRLDGMVLHFTPPIECDAIIYFSAMFGAESWGALGNTAMDQINFSLRHDGDTVTYGSARPVAYQTDSDPYEAELYDSRVCGSMHYAATELAPVEHEFEVRWGADVKENGFCYGRMLSATLFHR